MQLGFVIDHGRCIGCHACTVACKSENGVPLGAFRTWVKYTERGSFPDVRRSFAVLRCNQCTDAPCVEICPVHALDKRGDGIVDVDPDRCIGCKACMQACPYDALYINDARGVAEKCHFCAHRTERGLAPACAVVCPTEAIIPGDFHDPASVVSRMVVEGGLTARKVEAGTGPNVLYREVDEAGIDPAATKLAGGYLWSNPVPGVHIDAATFDALENRAASRTVYDVEHPAPWGGKVAAYLFTKSLAAGVVLASALLLPPLSLGSGFGHLASVGTAALALVFLALTSTLLVADLKRPERFWHILRYPNWKSWLTRGTVVLVGYGALLAVWLGQELLRAGPAASVGPGLVLLAVVAALLTACYTAWLFFQAKGRVLWMSRGLPLALALHAWVAGVALQVLVGSLTGLADTALVVLRNGLVVGLVGHAALLAVESRLGPRGREAEFRRAARLLTRGPFAHEHVWLGMVAGVVVPLVLLLLPASWGFWPLAAAGVLVGLYYEQDALVRAGQALPIS